MRSLLGYFSFSSKLIFSYSLLLLSIVICSYLLFTSYTKTSHHLSLELMGNRYQNAVRKSLEQMLRHQILSYSPLLESSAANSEAKEAQTKIHNELHTLLEKTQEYRDDLNLTQNAFKKRGIEHAFPPQIERNWTAFSEFNAVNLNNSYQTAAIQGIRHLLEHVGEMSTLFIDNHARTRRLIDIEFRLLPDLLINIGKLSLITQSLKKRKGFSEEDSRKLFALLQIIKEEREKIQNLMIQIHLEQKEHGNKAEAFNNLLITSGSFNEVISTLFHSVESLLTTEKLKEYDFATFHAHIIKAINSTNRLWEAVSNEVESLLVSRLYDYRVKQNSLIAVVLSLFFLGLLIAIATLGQLRSFINDLTEAVMKFKAGDLKARAKPVDDKELDELRQILTTIGDVLVDMVNQLQAAGVELTASTTQIAAAAKQQEGTIYQQETTVKEILVTANNISATAKDFAKMMNAVSANAEETSHIASSGKKGLQQMEDTMYQMVRASTNISAKLAVLNEKASAITSVITTITKVADQTNLLSLNAAIEAEKAGEHGKSFSVIAKEIRRLADQVANATLDIEKMITEMMSAVTEGVIGVDTFSEEIRIGVDQVSEVSNLFSEIISGVQLQTSSFESVNKRMQGLALDADQINEAIERLNQSVQETTSSIQQFHLAIESLTKSTKKMHQSLATVKPQLD